MRRNGTTGPVAEGAQGILIHPSHGAAIPGLSWVPAPNYLLRRARLLAFFRGQPRGPLLEIGCGAGALLHDLAEMGFEVTGVDRSDSALGLARALHREDGPVRILADLPRDEEGRFSHVCAFEVLEHIEDDVGALREWRWFLAPEGVLVLSVPARPELWHAGDDWAGHVRRYRRADLVRTVEAAGFSVLQVECYGFPLGNLMERVRARAAARRLRGFATAEREATVRTGESGTDRSHVMPFWPYLASHPGSWVMQAFCALQRPFLRSDLGNGYILVARRTGS